MSISNRALEKFISTYTNNGFGRITNPPTLPLSSPQFFACGFSNRKRTSERPVESSPLPIHQSTNEDSTADEEVDSTSECADSEYSIPPAKIPVFSSTLDEDAEETETKENSFPFPEISRIKSLIAAAENKCRYVYRTIRD